MAQSLFNRGGHGRDPAGYGRRLIQLCQALIYIAFAVSAVRILVGAGGSARGERRAVSGMLTWPSGPELVGAIGAVFVVVAAVNVYWGLSGRFRESLRLDELGPGGEQLVTFVGKIGFVALAVVLALIGWFLVKAAVDYDAKRIVSLGGALAKLAHAGYGRWLLGLTAAGLLSYGLYGILQVRYHRV